MNFMEYNQRVRRVEDREEIMAFFPDDVPEDTPHRQTALNAARQIIDELNNLTYEGNTSDDVIAIFQAVAQFSGAATMDMHFNDIEGVEQ